MEEDIFGFDETESIPAEGSENVEEGIEVSEEVGEDTTEPAAEETQTEEVQSDVPRIKVKYNKEERELTLDEATVLAQKGMNYDKLQERLNELQNNRGLSYLNELAQRNNTDVDTLVNFWQQQEEQARLNELVQQNIPEEYAREMLDNRKFRQEFEAKQQLEAQEQKQKAEINDFFNAFPEVKPNEIPVEVWQKTEQGVPLKFAYMEHEMSKLRNEVKVLKQNNKNKASSPSLGTTGFGSHDNSVSDPFLDGFNSI